MSILINKRKCIKYVSVIVFTAIFATYGFAENNQQISIPSFDDYLCYVLKKDSGPIKRYLNPKSGEKLYVFFNERLFTDEDTVYLVIYNSRKDKCVLYAFYREATISVPGNYGYGLLTKENVWTINPTDPKTGEIFESHGGEWSYKRISEVMKIGVHGKLMQVSWGK